MSINNANITISADNRAAIDQTQKLTKSIQELNNTVASGKNALASSKASWGLYVTAMNQYVQAVTTIINGLKSAMDFGREISALDSVRNSFERYTKSVGVNSAEVLNRLRKVSGGVIDDIRLMQSVSNAMAKGITTDSEKLADLMRVASQKAKIFGKDGAQAFDDLVNAISRGSEKALKEIGINVPEGFEKLTQGMSKAQKQSKLLEAAITEGTKEIASMGGELEDSSDAFARYDAALNNLKTTIGTAVLPILSDLAEILTVIINNGNKAIGVVATAMNLRENTNPYSAMSTQQLEEMQRQAQIRISDLKIKLSSTSSSDPSNSYRTSNKNTAEAGLDRQNNLAALYAEKRALNQINEALEKSRQLDEIRAEAEKKVAEEAERVAQATRNSEAQKAADEALKKAQEQAKEAEKLINHYGDLSRTILPEFSGKESDAYDLMVKISAAAGGIGTAFMQSDKELEAFNKTLGKTLEKLNSGIAESLLSDTALGKFNSKNFGDQAKGLISLLPTGVASFDGLGNIVAGVKKETSSEEIKKGYVSVRKMLHEDFTDAVVSGITNSNIGEVMRNMVSSIASAKANSYGSTLLGGLFSGNGFAGLGGAVSGFVGSIAISAIANNWKKWFGDKGKEETRASNAATIERGSNAYLQTYAAMLNPFMTNSMYSNLLDARYNSIGNMHVSWKSSSRGGLAGVFGGKNYRDTTPQSTFDVIQAMEDAVDVIKDYNKQEEKRLDLLSAQGYGYSVLSEQVSALSDAVDRANWMNDSYSINWTGGEHFEIDLSDNIQDLKKAYYEALREYGSETAQRNTRTASTFLQLFPYMQQMYDGEQFVRDGHMEGRFADNDNPYSSYNAFEQNYLNYMDRNANKAMFEYVKEAGKEQFSLQSLQYSDPLAYTEQYLTILERSRDAAELVMQKQQEIYFDAARTYEEQSAALDMYQQAQDQYYNSKLEILAQEQAKEEQVRKEEQQAALRSSERMEALLGFTGEIARTGNKVYILEGADQVGALKEMIQNYGDDPEALAALQSMLAAAQNKSKFGKIA